MNCLFETEPPIEKLRGALDLPRTYIHIADVMLGFAQSNTTFDQNGKPTKSGEFALLACINIG